MHYTKTILFFTLSIFCSTMFAQMYDGQLNFIGNTFNGAEPLPNVTIRVVSNSKIISEYNTKNKNKFKTELPFGNDYDVYFIHPGFQTMFARIIASNIPDNKKDYLMTYAFDVPFIKNDEPLLDTLQFRKPFHQLIFDGKSRFIDDKKYIDEFKKNVFLKESVAKKDTVIQIKEVKKELVKLAGKLCLDNDKQSALKNKTVSLLNKNGEVISISKTTNHGVFNFQKVDTDIADAIIVTLNKTDNPNNSKIKLQTTNSIKIDATDSKNDSLYMFKSTNNIISKLLNNNFDYSIAGKLIASNGTSKKIATNKTVFLMNENNEIVQTTKTNALGNFVFTNIEPDKTYLISYDETDIEPNYKMSLYTVKDQLIQELQPSTNKKFVYKFLSVSNSSFNALVMDESELKMGMSGRLCGNKKENPLTNLKIFLLNSLYEKVDSAVTNAQGDFTFKHVPYTKQLLITSSDDKNNLNSFENVLIYNSNGNLIKTVPVVNGNKFNYKPLATEQSTLSDIYVDDPWLSIIDKSKYSKNNKLSNKPIIENILFESNKAELKTESKLTLDKIVSVMQSNPSVKIELSAHSDSKGSDAYNLKLSEQRAIESKNYMVSKGIDTQRIKAVGYGETRLLNNCGNNSVCSEDEHAVNRRLEFIVNFN
jgi:outer membrane protein OmpA-like peptidoglycan-associated protein